MPQVISVRFSSPAGKVDERAAALGKNGRHSFRSDPRTWLTDADAYLNELIASLTSPKFTVLYTTTPPQGQADIVNDHAEQTYEMDEQYPSGLHVELKRDTIAYPRASNDSNPNADLPLFEKYQFLSSGK